MTVLIENSTWTTDDRIRDMKAETYTREQINRHATIAAARAEYIELRVEEIMSSPEEMVRAIRCLAETHGMKFSVVLTQAIRERAGGLAELIEALRLAAEDVAQQEWPCAHTL